MPSPDAMPGLRGTNLFLADPNLTFVARRVMGAETFERARPHLEEMGEVAGGELDALAFDADRYPPVLRAYDERGERTDEIVFHPAYHAMEEIAFSRFGLHAMSHRPGVLGWPTPVPTTVKYALSYLFAQAEFGLLCPVSLTDSTSRMLRYFGSDELKERYLPKLGETDLGALWQGTQWMTERTGGSDVGASRTEARLQGGVWHLYGDKWFCSNANAQVALTLARPEGAPEGTRGLGMFLVPRVLPDGSRNAVRVNRLKDKLGTRSMATGEVTYHGAVAYPVGELDRGFKQMAEMINVSRLSNAMRSAGMMRRCVQEAVVHARGKGAYGGALADLPLVRRDLLEILLDAEAACSVVLDAAAAIDAWDAGSTEARKLFRITTPLAKYWICDRARTVAARAMDVRGGNGYIEEWPNARLVRDTHLGSIWEGATNVVALDVERAILRDGSHEALFAHVQELVGSVSAPEAKPWCEEVLRGLDAAVRSVEALAELEREDRELEAHAVAEHLYHLLASSLLLAEGQELHTEGGSSRKFLAAALYIRRWLSRDGAHRPVFGAEELRRLDTLVDWEPVVADALPRPRG